MLRNLIAAILVWSVLLVPAHAMAAGTYNKGGSAGVVLVTESTLPGTGNSTLIYRITNATNSSDCAAGTPGTARADCRWNGTAYEPIGVAASGLTNPLVSDLVGASFDVTGVDEVGAANVNKVLFPSIGTLQAAIDACQKGSNDADPACKIVLPPGRHAVTSTIRLGGSTTATMQNGFEIGGHGAGILNSLGNSLSGTTLYWAGADGGTVMQVSGFGHWVHDLHIEGRSCVDLWSAGGPPQTTGAPDGLCDSDGATSQVQAAYGIKTTGDNSQSAPTGKNVFERIVITGVLDASAGYGIAVGDGTAGHDDQNDQQIFEQVRFSENRHCILHTDSQAVGNEFRMIDCRGNTADPAIDLQYGHVSFYGGFMGNELADAEGFSIDYCMAEFTIDGIAFENFGGGVYRAIKSNNGFGGACGFGNNYQSRITNNRIQMLADSSASHYCLDWDAQGSLLIQGNIWMSNSAGVARRCAINLPAPGTRDRFITMAGNKTAWANGSDSTDIAITISAAGGALNKVLRGDRGRWELLDKDGATALAKDVTGLYVDADNDGTFDAGELRLDAASVAPPVTFSGSTADPAGTDVSSGLWIGVTPDGNPATIATIDTIFDNSWLTINGTGAAEECGFTTSGTGSGGFLCEGPEADPTDHYFTFPLVPDSGADTERFFAFSSAGILDALSAATAAATYQAKSGLTINRCLRTDGSGNIVVAAGDCLNGDTGGGGGAVVLDDLTDVVITTPATGAPIFFDGANWIDGALSLADSDAVSGELPDANVANNITASNYLPLAGGTLTGSLNLTTGFAINVPTGATVQSTGGTIVATSMSGGSTIDDNDLAAGAVDGGTGGEIEDATLTAADLGPGSLTAADAAADLATQAELDALTLPNSGQTGNRIVKSTGTAGDVVESGASLDASNNLSGVGTAAFTGTVTAPSFDANAPAGTGVASLVFKEGVTDGSNTVTIQGPAGGFAANRSCTLQDDATPLDNCVSGGSGGAPTTVPYFTNAADGTLSAEIVAGTGVATAFAINVGSAGAFVTNGGALGTPSSGNASNLTNIPAANVTGSLDLGTGTIRGAVSIESTTSTSHTLASAEGQWLLADETGTTTVSLPAASSGANVCVYAKTDQQIHIDPNGVQVMVLNGTALTGGNKISSPASPTAGNFACVLSDGTSWFVLGKAGTWTDGG